VEGAAKKKNFHATAAQCPPNPPRRGLTSSPLAHDTMVKVEGYVAL
jgi:hypothetical protein